MKKLLALLAMLPVAANATLLEANWSWTIYDSDLFQPGQTVSFYALLDTEEVIYIDFTEAASPGYVNPAFSIAIQRAELSVDGAIVASADTGTFQMSAYLLEHGLSDGFLWFGFDDWSAYAIDGIKNPITTDMLNSWSDPIAGTLLTYEYRPPSGWIYINDARTRFSDRTDLMIVEVPEPSTAALFLLAMLGLLHRSRSRLN